jgi:hypothetical protein
LSLVLCNKSLSMRFSLMTCGGLRCIFLFSQSLGEGASVFSFCLFVDFPSLHRKRDGVSAKKTRSSPQAMRCDSRGKVCPKRG